MKSKIFKILSLLLVLTLLATTCMHSAWSVIAADASAYVISKVTPKLEQGTISNTGEAPLEKRLRTSGYYSTADFESVTISSGYKVSYHFYSLTTTNNVKTYTWKGKSNDWLPETSTVAEILSSAVDSSGNKLSGTGSIYFFRIILAAFEGKEKDDPIDPDTFNGLQLTLKSHNTELPQPVISKGTIDNGAVMTSSDTRAHTQYLLPIEDYESVKLNSGYKALCHFYDAEGRWIKKYPDNWKTGTGDEIFDLTETSTIPSNAKYFKICFASTTDNVKMDETQITSAGLVITPVNTTPDYSTYYNNNGGQGLKNTFAKFNNGTADAINVVYMGGSITVGAGLPDNEKETLSWRALTTKWLNENSNGDTINSINAAYGETGTLFGAYRLNSEILNNEAIGKPDLIFLEFAINDLIDGNKIYDHKELGDEAYPKQNAAANMQFESIVRTIRNELPNCDIVTVLTTNENYAKQTTPDEWHRIAKEHKDISVEYKIPTVNAGYALAQQYDPSNKPFTTDGTHPNDLGHSIYAASVNAYFESEKERCNNSSDTTPHTLPAQINKTLINPMHIEYMAPSQYLLDRSAAHGSNGFTFADDGYAFKGRGTMLFETGFSARKNDAELTIEFTGSEFWLLEDNNNGAINNIWGVKVKIDDDTNWTYVQTKDVKPLLLTPADLKTGYHTITISPMFDATDYTPEGLFQTSGFFVVNDGSANITPADLVYYASANADEDGDGTESNPFDSINDAIKCAVEKGVPYNETVTINLKGNGVSWTNDKDNQGKLNKQLDTHKFKILIKTAEGESSKATISKDGEFGDYHMGGSVEFDNVNIAFERYNKFFHKNNSVVYNETVSFVDKDGKVKNDYAEISLGGYTSTGVATGINVYNKNIDVVIKVPISKIYLSNYKGYSQINGTMNILYDAKEGEPDFRLGPDEQNGTYTTFNKNIYMTIENASSISFDKRFTNNVLFGMNSCLQVLNNTEPQCEIANNVALDNASSVWIVHNKLVQKEKVQFDSKKGIFKITDDSKVYAFKDDEQVTESYNGQINIGEFGAGIYSFEAEGDPSIRTYTQKDGDSIAAIINKALAEQGEDEEDFFDQIKVDLSTYVGEGFPVGNLATVTKDHTFEVIVISESTNKPIITFNQQTTFRGDMKFNNVTLNFPNPEDKTKGDFIFLDGHNIEITTDAKISSVEGTMLGRIYTSAKNGECVYNDTQNIIIAADYDKLVYFGTYTKGANTTFNGDLNLVINNASSRTIVEMSRKNATTTFNGNLNINAKRFAKLNLHYVHDGVLKGENSSVQIIHDDIPYKKTDDTQTGVHWATANYGDDEGNTPIESYKQLPDPNFVDYHIIDKSFNTGCIDCTDKAGVYTSNTEFIISAFYNNNLNAESVDSVDEVLKLTQPGEWTLTTTNYFEDFKGTDSDEFSQDWDDRGLSYGYLPANNGSWSLYDEKILLTSATYLLQDDRFIKHKTIKSKTQFISMDFESSDIKDYGISSTYKGSTSVMESRGNGNVRDNGAGVALYARLSGGGKTFSAYELKVANGYIILTKRSDSRIASENVKRPSSNAVYTKSYYVDQKLVSEEEYNNSPSTVKETRHQLKSSDFDTSHIKSHLKYNRFPESYDEGNSINLNPEHIYRLGMSVVDGTEDAKEGTNSNGEKLKVAYVRILLLDVTTNTLVVDETFKDVKNPFQGEEFGFGLYGTSQTGDSKRYCEALVDNIWFSTKRFRGGDMAEFKDINYDSYFDIRDLVRTYEYMGGTNARINFRAADYDYNGFITTSDESAIRKEILHDGKSEFGIKGQIEEEANALKNNILSVGSTNGSGVKPVEGETGKFYYYYPDYNGEALEDYDGKKIVLNNAYYVANYSDPEDPKNKLETDDLDIDDKTKPNFFVAGRLNAEGVLVPMSGSQDRMICTNYFLRYDLNFAMDLTSTGTYAQVYFYDKDFNFLGRSQSLNLQNLSYHICNDLELNIPKDKKASVKLIEQGTITFKPAYIKIQLANNAAGYQFAEGAIANKVNDLSNNAHKFTNVKISAIDYYKDKSGTEENPWTFRQFQLYGDAFPQVYSGTPIDPLCVIKSGDAVLFKRGDVFTNIEHLKVVSLEDQLVESYAAFHAQEGVVYGAYGTGAKPTLNASAKDYKQLESCPQCEVDPAACPANKQRSTNDDLSQYWHKAPNKEHVYWCDVKDVTEYTDLRDNSVLNVIFNGGEKIGVRKFFASDLHTIYKDGQYTTDQANGRLYLYCQYFGDDNPVSPNKKYSEINLTRCMYGAHGHRGNNGYVIDNINFHGFGSGAFKGSGKSKNIKISNCEIGFSGGMMYLSEIHENYHTTKSMEEIILMDDINEQAEHLTLRLGLRYGNGVEMWQSSENFEIEHSYIYHTFDSAVSPQGDYDSSGHYDGFALRNNLFQFNNADLEYFDNIQENDEDKTLLTNVEIVDNIFQFTSFGWGTRESDKIRSIQGVLRMDMKYDAAVCIDFVNNKIDTPAMEVFLIKNRINESESYIFGESFVSTKYKKTQADLNGDTPKLGNNDYYFNYYVRNYPKIVSGYFKKGTDLSACKDQNDNPIYAGPDQMANNYATLRDAVASVDLSVTAGNSRVHWFSWEIA